jgi:hypothetical protein
MVFNPSGTSTTTYGALGSIPSTTVFSGLLVANTGTANVYLNYGSVSPASSGSIGVLLPTGGQMLLTGYAGTVGTAGTLWAQTGTVGLTGSVQAGLPSVVSVI